MRIDRERFLLLAVAISACHGSPARGPEAGEPTEAEQPATPARPPADSSVATEPTAPATGEQESAPVVTVDIAPPLDADAGADATARGGQAEDPADKAESGALVPTLARRCRALPRVGDYCGDENPRLTICQRVVAQFRPVVARAAVACLEALDSSCDYCGVRQCAKLSLERAWDARPAGAMPHMAECDSVRKQAEQEQSDGTQYAELCTRYAWGMNRAGRRRFARCMAGSIGIGVRYCLWDPKSTPCTEGQGSPGRPGGHGLEF